MNIYIYFVAFTKLFPYLFECINIYILIYKFKKIGEQLSERNEITSRQLTDTGELIKVNTVYCDNSLGNTLRILIWNNIDCILYNVVRRAIATRFEFAHLLKGLIRRHAKKKKNKRNIAVYSKSYVGMFFLITGSKHFNLDSRLF